MYKRQLLVLALPAEAFESLLKKLTLFRLRSQVTLAEDTSQTLLSAFAPDVLAYGDSRAEGLTHGLSAAPEGQSAQAFHQERGARGIPEGGHDLIVGKSTLLDEGLACAIDWQKGCYMGQEVTARMRYRALLKRVLVPFDGQSEAGQDLRVDNRKIGQVRATYGARGFAYVMKDYVGSEVAGLRLGQPMGLAPLGL